MTAKRIRFDFSANPNDANGTSYRDRYQTSIAVARHGHALGFDTVWLAEHNFTDYFPTPSPLVTLSHIAAHCPGLGLGTQVLVSPWYNPVRLASEIAMLATLTTGHLHMGLGRGTAPREYQGYGIDMNKSLALFRETVEILQRALTGEPFTYAGEEFQIERPTRIMPTPDARRITLYGAATRPQSSERLAALDLGLLHTPAGSHDSQRRMIAAYETVLSQHGFRNDRGKPVLLGAVIAPTDAEAVALAREHAPQFFALSAAHYEADAGVQGNYRDYEDFVKFFERMKTMRSAEGVDGYIYSQLVGSPDTVAKRVQGYIDAGFDRIIVHGDLPSVPRRNQLRNLELFAREVAPRFDPQFGPR